MGPQMAVTVLETWQAVVLILLCFGSLIIALYCLFFMVPLKSFVRRINSLGGGVRGIRAHVDGVRKDTEHRIGAVEHLLRDELTRMHSELQDSLEAVAQRAGEAQSGLQRLDRTVQRFQADLRQHPSDGRRLSEALAQMHKDLAELRNDLDVVETELRGSVGQFVSDSYKQLEGTVLSALEVLQDEMLRGASKLRRAGDSAPSRRPDGRDSMRRPSGKIIPAEPLFADLDRGHEAANSKGEEGEPQQKQEDPAPAK